MYFEQTFLGILAQNTKRSPLCKGRVPEAGSTPGVLPPPDVGDTGADWRALAQCNIHVTSVPYFQSNQAIVLWIDSTMINDHHGGSFVTHVCTKKELAPGVHLRVQ